ncbi:response regulator [Sinorhizobium medicae]|nr:response regulator [Sinorhizobium medicae]MQX98038.1 response regulator [Sinorhizobium medicae]
MFREQAVHNHLILIVEDHWEIREVMEQYLSREGFRTDYAFDGTLGLAQFRQLKPDLVVRDVGLPSRDGYEVLIKMRRQGDTPALWYQRGTVRWTS